VVDEPESSTPSHTHNIGGITPIEERILDFGDTTKVVRRFRLTFDEPLAIPVDDFIRDNTVFTLNSLIRIDTDQTEHSERRYEVSIETVTSDINEIMSQLARTIEYDNNGFVGTLTLDNESITTVEKESTSRWISRSLAHTYFNLAYGDTSQIARTITRGGITYSLDSVSWSENTIPVDFTQVARSFNAVATYVGGFNERVITGFITTAAYYGEVVNIDHNPEIIYEVVFVPAPTIEADEPLQGGIVSGQGYNGSVADSEETEVATEIVVIDETSDESEIGIHESETYQDAKAIYEESEYQPEPSSNIGGIIVGGIFLVILVAALGLLAAFRMGWLQIPDFVENLLGRGNSNDEDSADGALDIDTAQTGVSASDYSRWEDEEKSE